MIIIFLLWFVNFPTLRYSGYLIVFLLIIFPYSIFIQKKIDFSKKNITKKLSIIFLISFTIFISKNIYRLNHELSIAESIDHNFKNFPFFWIQKNEFKKIKVDDHQIYLTKGKCWAVPSTCVRGLSGLKIYKINNYIFYSIK